MQVAKFGVMADVIHFDFRIPKAVVFGLSFPASFSQVIATSSGLLRAQLLGPPSILEYDAFARSLHMDLAIAGRVLITESFTV